MHYTSSKNWRPGRQTMVNINPWEPVPFEQTSPGIADNQNKKIYSKNQPEKHHTRQH